MTKADWIALAFTAGAVLFIVAANKIDAWLLKTRTKKHRKRK